MLSEKELKERIDHFNAFRKRKYMEEKQTRKYIIKKVNEIEKMLDKAEVANQKYNTLLEKIYADLSNIKEAI